jgi:DNA-binding YbaB/EbfC family protein
MADFMGLMKQAGELKSKMEAMGAELEQAEIEGTAGAGLVTVRLNGKGDMQAVKIDESLIKPGEKEIVEDLVGAAFADARRKVEILMQDKMRAVTGGLPLPPGLVVLAANCLSAGKSSGGNTVGWRNHGKRSIPRRCRAVAGFWRVTC